MASFNGYKLWAGGQPDFQYPVSGDASDYMYAAMGVASFGYEIGEAFYEDCEIFDERVAPDNVPSLMYVSRAARRPFRTAKGPDVLKFEVVEEESTTSEETGEAAAAAATTMLDVVVTASDDELVNSNGLSEFRTGRQGVETVRLYVDVHPDDDVGGEETTEMEPVGTNNNSRRSFELRVSTDGMAPGRHTMYAVAVDGAGYAGPVSAVFFDVPVRAAIETGRPMTSAPQTAEPTTVAPVSESPTATTVVAPVTDEPSSQAPTIGKVSSIDGVCRLLDFRIPMCSAADFSSVNSEDNAESDGKGRRFGHADAVLGNSKLTSDFESAYFRPHSPINEPLCCHEANQANDSTPIWSGDNGRSTGIFPGRQHAGVFVSSSGEQGDRRDFRARW